MTSYELAHLLRRFAWLTKDTEHLKHIIRICAEHGPSLDEEYIHLFQVDKKDAGSQIASLKSNLAGAARELKSISTRKVFSEAEQLIDQLIGPTRMLDAAPNFPLFAVMVKALDRFIDVYESFINEPGTYTTWALVEAGSYLYTVLNTFQLFASFVVIQLEPTTDTEPGLKELSIFMSYATGYDDVVTKLLALGEIHTELCNLLGVSTSETKLEIRKIESGSLWISVLGNALIIGFIISLIKSAISFIHRNYTREGRIAFIPRELEAADNVLQFTKMAQEAGLDVTASKENVQKALFNISSKLNDLVADQPSLEVNGEVHSVAQAQDERYLRESKRLLLEDGKQDEQ